MTDTDDYITTTGERWVINKAGVPYEPGGSPVRITRAAVTAELRALRAQRDEKAAEWGYYDEEIARCREIVSQHRGGAEPSEELHNDVQQLVDDVVALRAQRDELLAALELAASGLGETDERWVLVHDAIAKGES